MSDHEEYAIRSNKLKTDPLFANFKEGIWRSPKGAQTVKVCVTYYATAINITSSGAKYSGTIYPFLWDTLFSEWEFLGPNKEDKK